MTDELREERRMNEPSPVQSTPAPLLNKRLHDPCEAKTELEHYASRRIQMFETMVKEMQGRIEELQNVVDIYRPPYEEWMRASGLGIAQKEIEKLKDRIDKCEVAFAGMKAEEKITRVQRDRWYQAAGERQKEVNAALTRVAEIQLENERLKDRLAHWQEGDPDLRRHLLKHLKDPGE